MGSNLRTLEVNNQTKIADILASFESTNQDLLLIDENTRITKPHLELLTDYPRTQTTALVTQLVNGEIRVGGARITSASSTYHRVEYGNHRFLGLIRLSQNQRAEILKVLTEISDKSIEGEAIDLILVGLVRAAVIVAPAIVVGAPCIRTSNKTLQREVEAEISDLNDAKLRLKLANRANDGFYSVFFLRKISKLFTWLAVKLNMTPNQVTLISFAIGIFSAYQFSLGTYWTIFSGAVLLQLSIIIDCVDGELARYNRTFSALGAWLDAITDRIKEYLVFFALAYGAAKSGRDLWIPAIGMMIFQTFRHLSDYNFARINKFRAEEIVKINFDDKSDGYIRVEREKSSRLEYWGKKAVQFPIGERWLAISASSVIGGAAFTFTIMPILSLISIALVFRARIRKTLTWPKFRVNKSFIDDQLDSFKSKNSVNRFDWLEPSILRLVEGLIFVEIAIISEVNRAEIFFLLFAIVFNHYDNMYRALQGERKPKWLAISGGYIFGRLALIFIWISLGLPMLILVFYFSILFFVVSSAQWILSHRAKGE